MVYRENNLKQNFAKLWEELEKQSPGFTSKSKKQSC